MAWWPLIEPGGMLTGDDYFPTSHAERTESVSLAIEAFAKSVGQPIISLHRNFFICKPLA